MDEKEIPKNLRDEEEEGLSDETKSLISSLPSDRDFVGIKVFKYEGCWYYKEIIQSILNFKRNFQPQETDIIVASFPKCGTTWLKAITFALVQRSKHPSDDDDHPLLSHNPHDLVPFLDFGFNKYYKSLTTDLTKFSSASLRLFSTHMPLHTLQEGLKDSPCKIVYLCRNVKDVLVSLWFFLNSNKGVEWSSHRENINGVENCTIEAMLDSFCSGVSVYGPFWDHVLSYWRGSLEDPKHALFMRFEELKAEPRGQIKKLAEFLDCPFTKEEEDSGSVDKILELCSLSNLSGLEINKTGKTWNGLRFRSFFP